MNRVQLNEGFSMIVGLAPAVLNGRRAAESKLVDGLDLQQGLRGRG